METKTRQINKYRSHAMRIGLIEACDPDWQFKRFSYPLQLGYLASYLKSNNHNLEVTVSEELEEIFNAKPDIVGISSYSLNYDIAVDFAQKIKDKLGIPVVLGGCHISALPHTFKPVFDLGVIGEGEVTFNEIVKLYGRERKFAPESLEKIPGLVFFKDGHPAMTEPRPSMQIIDRIPPPDRSIFTVRSGNHFISTSRGCPFKCLFCAPRLMWKKPRFFSARYVMREIMGIIQAFSPQVTHLTIVDDLFIVNQNRLQQLAGWFTESGLSKLLICQANVRADLIDDDMAALLSRMNFTTVNFGAESGSDKILKYYNKKTTVEINQQAVDILYKHGIKAIPSFIIGAPVETEEDFDATLAFIEKNHEKLAGFEIFPLIPMPGSQMWTYAVQKGIVNDSIRWARLEPLLLDFDPEQYFYMVEAVSRETFLGYIEKFQDIYRTYNPEAMKFRGLLEKMKEKKS